MDTRRTLEARRDEIRARVAELAKRPELGAAQGFGKRIGDGTTEAISRITDIGVGRSLEATLARYRMGSGHARMFPEKNWGLAVINKALAQWGVTGPEGRALSARQIRRRLWQLNFDFGYGQLRLGRLGPAQEAFLGALRQRPCHARTLTYFLASTLGKWRNRAGASGAFS